MYAIIRSGGKQYKVEPGDVLRVEKIEQDLGAEFNLTEVLMVGGDKTFVGQPLVKNASVTVVVTQQDKGPKIVVFKKRRRQGYRKTQGHRQPFTELFVKSITSPEGDVSNSEAKALVIDPAKKQERLAKLAAAEAQKDKKAAKAAKAEKAAAKKAAPKKKVAKKAAGKTAKKARTKKSGKKVAKKKTAKK